MRFLEGVFSMSYIPSDFEQLVWVQKAGSISTVCFGQVSSYLQPSHRSKSMEYTTKYIPFILNDKPDFVDKTYFLSLKCTTKDGTTTAVQWPMISVNTISFLKRQMKEPKSNCTRSHNGYCDYFSIETLLPTPNPCLSKKPFFTSRAYLKGLGA